MHFPYSLGPTNCITRCGNGSKNVLALTQWHGSNICHLQIIDINLKVILDPELCITKDFVENLRFIFFPSPKSQGQIHHDERVFLGSLFAKGLYWLCHASCTFLTDPWVAAVEAGSPLPSCVMFERLCFFLATLFVDLTSSQMKYHINTEISGDRVVPQRHCLISLNSKVLVTLQVFYDDVSDKKQWKGGRVCFDSYCEGAVHGHGAWVTWVCYLCTEWAWRDGYYYLMRFPLWNKSRTPTQGNGATWVHVDFPFHINNSRNKLIEAQMCWL